MKRICIVEDDKSISGELLLKQLRTRSEVSVIMVTSRDSEADEVLSMSYGADDYVTKPYNPTILLLRINAIFKRLGSRHGSDGTIVFRDMQILPQKGVIRYNSGMLCPPTNCVDFAMWLLYNVYVRFQTAFTAE